jgi:conjugative transfer signal peptidase TraF
MMICPGLLAPLKAGVLTVIIVAGVYLGFSWEGIRINASTSLPIGVYRTTSDSKARLVEFCPEEPFASLSVIRGYRKRGSCPDGAEPLMKPIVAVPGDLIEISSAGIAVNGKLLPNSSANSSDRNGRPLKHWPFGNSHVSSGTVWVISDFNPHSFDSRYFGPISRKAIRSYLQPLLTE